MCLHAADYVLEGTVHMTLALVTHCVALCVGEEEM